jgi:methionyl-tRNA synthetase
MPFTAEKILRMLGYEKFGWDALGRTDLLEAGHTTGEVELLFEKIEDSVVDAQIAKLEASRAANQAAAPVEVEEQKPHVSFDEWERMDIRIGTVLAAEKVAKTKKLMKLTIDTGIDTREIVSGIAEYFTPEELVGKQVTVLVNLEPRELKGTLSRGMVLMTEAADGKYVLVSPTEKVPNGGTVR